MDIICSKCSTSFEKPPRYIGEYPLCSNCRNNKKVLKWQNNYKHFICNGCSLAVNFCEETIPECYLIGIRPFCFYCITYYFYQTYNQSCSLCCLPIASKYQGSNSLCTKCRLGCFECKSKKDLVFGVNFRKIVQNYDFTPQCYCRKCYKNSNLSH